MKVKELLAMLEGVNPEASVMIYDRGTVIPTGTVEQHSYHNIDDNSPDFLIGVCEDWEE